jgi:hypothetical protein
MREFFQQHSYIFISLGVVVGSIIVAQLLRLHWSKKLATIGLTTFLLALAFVVLHPGVSDVDNVQAADEMLRNGRPTFLEFFSNY